MVHLVYNSYGEKNGVTIYHCVKVQSLYNNNAMNVLLRMKLVIEFE